MNVLVSAFRNSPEANIKRWSVQVASLGTLIRTRALAVVGDCRRGDKTAEMLVEYAHRCNINLSVLAVDHGGPVFGSVEDPERMRCLSIVGDAWLSSIRTTDDIVTYVESDLIWDGNTLHRLAQYAAAFGTTGYDVVAPMVFAGENFYDVWGFRRDGARFAPFPPYHSSLAHFNGTILGMDSVGSCVSMRAAVALDTRCRMGTNAFVGWCENVNEAGYKIGVVPSLRIEHPA